MRKSEVIDYTADNGGFILKEKRYLGMYFDTKSWDGTDIFMMENTTHLSYIDSVDLIRSPVYMRLLNYSC